MNRSAFITAFAFVLFVIALATTNGGLLVLAIPFIIYLLLGLWSLPEKIELEITRSMDSERVNPNDLVRVEIFVRNRGAEAVEVLIEDQIPEGVVMHSGSPRQLVMLPGNGEKMFEYVISASRGTYHFDGLRVKVGDALGLMRHAEVAPVQGQLYVVPNVLRLKRVAIRPRRTRLYTGNIPARVGGSGTEFFGVRNYQPGDPPRAINWRASARHSGMYSNEFQQERVTDVGIVLDARRQANVFAGDRSMLDHSIMAAAALTDVFLSQGNRVGMLIQSSTLSWSYPGYGKVQRERIMRTLMGAHLGDSQVVMSLPRLLFGKFSVDSQIVLVSPLITDPLIADDLDVVLHWRARGYQVLVIIPDPVSFELSRLPVSAEKDLAGRMVHLERRTALNRLLHAGVQIVEWNVEMPFDQAVSPYLSRPVVGQFAGRLP